VLASEDAERPGRVALKIASRQRVCVCIAVGNRGLERQRQRFLGKRTCRVTGEVARQQLAGQYRVAIEPERAHPVDDRPTYPSRLAAPERERAAPPVASEPARPELDFALGLSSRAVPERTKARRLADASGRGLDYLR